MTNQKPYYIPILRYESTKQNLNFSLTEEFIVSIKKLYSN